MKVKNKPLESLKAVSGFWAGFFGMGLLVLLAAPASQAQTWLASPTSGDWNTDANWDTGVPVNSQNTTVVFGASAQTNLTLGADVSLGEMDFVSGASNFDISMNGYSMQFGGAGIVNGTGQTLNNNSGALAFNNGSTAGAAVILNDETLNFNDGSSAGSAVITNSGNFYFSGDGDGAIFSTAGNSTINNLNYLEFNDYSTAGSASITNNYVAFFKAHSTAGHAAIDNQFDLEFHDNSSAGSASILNEGYVMSFNDGSSAGAATIDNEDNLSFKDSSTAGSANITNNGALTFTGDGDGTNFSTAGNSTLTNNNYVEFNDFATAGNATITNAETGTIHFLGSATAEGGTITNEGGLYFLGDSAGDTARVINGETGLVDISGDSSPVSVGSIEGSGDFYLGANSLTTGSNNMSATVSGILLDGGFGGGAGGSLVKTGTGVLILTGVNAYTGGTEIDGGGLMAGNSQAFGMGQVSLNDGGTLGFTAPLTVEVGAGYTQASGGTLQWGLGGTGQGDLLSVQGTASLDGTLDLVSINGFHLHRSETFTLVSSDTSISGQFASVEDSMEGTDYSIAYNGSEVLVTLTGLTFAQLGVSQNQKAVGTVLDFLNDSSEKQSLINALDYQSNASLPKVYDEISPALVTSIYQIGFALAKSQGAIIEQRLSQLWNGKGEANLAWSGPEFASTLPASEEKAMALGNRANGWGAFAAGTGDFGVVSSDGNGAGYQYSTGGMEAGLDCRLARDITGGIFIGYDQSGTGKSMGQVSDVGGQVGFYGGWKSDDFHLAVLASGELHNYKIERVGYGGTAGGNTQGLQYSGWLSAGFDWGQEQVKLGPFFSAEYSSVNISAFQESGSMAPLSYGAQGESYLSGDLGMSVSRDWNWGGTRLSPSLKLSWEHIYQGTQDQVQAALGDNFSVAGPALGTDAAAVNAGLDIQFHGGLGAFVQYRGLLGLTNYAAQGFSGGVSLGF